MYPASELFGPSADFVEMCVHLGGKFADFSYEWYISRSVTLMYATKGGIDHHAFNSMTTLELDTYMDQCEVFYKHLKDSSSGATTVDHNE
jgi:hypothetical protein